MELPISDLQFLGSGAVAVVLVFLFLKAWGRRNGNANMQDLAIHMEAHNKTSEDLIEEVRGLRTDLQEFWKEYLRHEGGDDD